MIDHYIANENATKKFTDIRMLRSLEIGSDHFFVQGKIRLHTTKRLAEKIKKIINIRALDDPTNKWLYQRRLNIINKATPRGGDVEKEWTNIKNIIMKADKESLGMVPCKTNAKSIKNWMKKSRSWLRKKERHFVNR